MILFGKFKYLIYETKGENIENFLLCEIYSKNKKNKGFEKIRFYLKLHSKKMILFIKINLTKFGKNFWLL